MNKLVYDDIVKIIGKISNVMAENKDYLCNLDAQMGDGDLGITMSKGWAAAAETALAFDGTDIGKMLIKSGMKMSSAVPSTMGTLMSSGLIEAGKMLIDKTELNIKGLSDFLAGFSNGIIKIGHCSPNDRTVLDSIWPAAKAAEKFDAGISLKDAVASIRMASKEGLENTKNMLPKFGKAAVFSSKAQGRIDQGAAAGFLIIDVICTYIEMY